MEQVELGRIRLKCRRGMLELDIILQRFIKEKLESLSLEQLKVLDSLLDQPDPVLFDWFLQHDKPEDKNYQSMVELILLK